MGRICKHDIGIANRGSETLRKYLAMKRTPLCFDQRVTLGFLILVFYFLLGHLQIASVKQSLEQKIQCSKSKKSKADLQADLHDKPKRIRRDNVGAFADKPDNVLARFPHYITGDHRGDDQFHYGLRE